MNAQIKEVTQHCVRPYTCTCMLLASYYTVTPWHAGIYIAILIRGGY